MLIKLVCATFQNKQYFVKSQFNMVISLVVFQVYKITISKSNKANITKNIYIRFISKKKYKDNLNT